MTASDVTGRAAKPGGEIGVVCIMDMGNTAALMKAYPVLPPRQSSYMKKAIWAKWLKVRFEKYFLWKMKRGFSNLL